jgi:fibronectin type 3 domain-containing protein
MKTQRILRMAAVLCTALFMTMACSDPLEGIMVKPRTPAAPELEAGVGTLAVSWEAVDLADSYNLYYAESETRPETPSVSEIANTSWTISGLTNEKTYYVWVQAVNTAGASKISERAEKTLTLAAPVMPVLAIGKGSITVTWEAVDLADSYNLYYSDSGMRPEVPQETGIAGTLWTINGLTNGKTYYVWVQAENAGGKLAVSGMAQIKLGLAAPANPVLSPGKGSITVSWEAVELADSYSLYYADSETRPETPQKTGIADTSWTIGSGLTNGKTYYVWVQAENTGGKSAASAVAQVKLGPDAPAEFTLSPGKGSIIASWEAVEFADSYNLYYADSETRPETPQKIGIAGTSWTIDGLANEKTYYVWVQAVNTAGGSTISERAEQTLSLEAPPEPVLTPGNGSITVKWDAVDLAGSYNLYYSTGTTPPETPSVLGIAGTSWTINGLTNATTYYIWVQAENSGGKSAVSGIAQVELGPDTPEGPTDEPEPPPEAVSAPATPVGLTATGRIQFRLVTGSYSTTSYSIIVSWVASPGATNYKVYYATKAGGPYTERVLASDTSVRLTVSSSSTDQYIKVSALNSAGESPLSAYQRVTSWTSSGQSTIR